MIDDNALRNALKKRQIVWRKHALERMFERQVSRKDVMKALSRNDRIEEYPDDTPFPSALFFGKVGSKILHVVAAVDKRRQEIHVISAYEPDDAHFEKDKRTRRKKR
jgi:hypothetical protein